MRLEKLETSVWEEWDEEKKRIKEEIKRNGDARRRKERARILEYMEREKGKGKVSMRYPKPVGRICPEAVIDKVSLSQPHIYAPATGSLCSLLSFCLLFIYL